MNRRTYPAVDAVGELIRTRVEWVELDDGGRRRVTVPCLLQLLIVHLHSSTTGRGGGHSIGSVPINTAAWDLLVEIRTDAYAWAELLDVDPKPYTVVDTPRAGKPTTPPEGKLLRAVAVAAETTARQPVADAIARYARRWAQQIETIVAGQPEQRDVRGATCTACGGTTVVEERHDPGNRRRDDGRGSFAVPALALVTSNDEPTLYCRACGWTSPLTALAITGPPVTVVITSGTCRDDHPVDGRAGQAA